jgi:hypothetical protein
MTPAPAPPTLPLIMNLGSGRPGGHVPRFMIGREGGWR